jgi:Acyl-CoA carboxylase epsilon subunit
VALILDRAVTVQPDLDRPAVHVVAGTPTREELAALLVALRYAARQATPAISAPHQGRRPGWRRAMFVSPSSWRRSQHGQGT